MKEKFLTLILATIFLFIPQTTFGQTASYNLPYPGMLPDNPLYKLKVLRDKISLFFISDPNKKVEYYLLLADKGIAATDILVKNGKLTLAEETALKGENNYTLLTYTIKDNKWEIKKDLYKKVELAALKHQEVLRNIIGKTKSSYKKTFETVFYFSQKNLEEIKNNKPK